MKFRAAREATCALLILAWRPAISRPMRSIVVYSDTNCKGTPIRVTLVGDEECTSDKAVCTSDGQSVGTQYTSSHCVDVDRHTYVAEIFSEFSFVTMEYYTDDGCDTFQGLNSFLAAGTCQHVGFGNDTSSSIVRLYSNGTAVLQLFEDTFCGIDANSTMHIDSSDITEHTCFGSSSGVKFFSSQSPTSSYSSPGLSVGEIIGTVVGSVVFLLLVAAVFVWRRRSKPKRWHPSEEVESPIDHQCDDSKLNTSYESDATERGTMAEVHVPRGSSMNSGVGGVWDDEAIVAVRIPRKKVFVHELMCRDGYAEVFKGTFNGQLVSVKTLLPQTRKNVECVTNFCSEVKMLTTMDHPRIAQLIGVAWDNRMDVCIVSEYLDGGDVRGLLDSFAQLQHPAGFDYDKVKIALHIAHALTYLHSLEPPVIHRNLKSKNVLLSYELDAKLTDFGISREQMDTTMTAGVGSALWMAPEVVMGHRYDEKADIFSFGVVLSELDVHALPYSHAEAQNKSRHKMPESLILQQMVAGKLQAQFSQTGSGSTQQLGRDCVAVNPDQRPTAAEVLYKLHKILTLEM